MEREVGREGEGGEEREVRTVLVEGAAAEQQLVGHHSQAVEVRLGAVNVVFGEHLRGQVLLGPAGEIADERLVSGGEGLHVGHAEANTDTQTDRQTQSGS